LNHVFGSQSTRHNDGDAHTLNNLPVQIPVVGEAQGTDLFVAGLMAVQKQKIGNSIVGFCDRHALAPDHGNASHDRQEWEPSFEGSDVSGYQNIRVSAQVQNRRIQLGHNFADPIQVCGQRQSGGF